MLPCVICLGRHGDVLNALPIAKEIADNTGSPAGFLVSQEFAPTLDGASYVRPHIWPGDYSQLLPAVDRIRAQGWHPVVAQVFGGPAYHNHLTSSYQKEAWKSAGVSEKFGSRRLDMDMRNPEREEELWRKVVPDGRPFVLVCGNGISSPISKLDGLVDRIRREWPKIAVVDLQTVRAHRVYDLLGLMDRAELLVSVDTVHVHLARASACPVVAVLNDDWRGSVPPPSTVAVFRYASVTVDAVMDAVAAQLDQPKRRVFHAVNTFGTSRRHLAAMESWGKCLGLIPAYSKKFHRTAKNIGDKRDLPYLNDILAKPKAGDDDVIIWTNDDVCLAPGIVEWAKRHAGAFGAVTMRRNEPGHCGRELFAFTKRWLKKNPLPEFFIGAHQFDIAVAAIIRYRRGILSTRHNMREDFLPCDSPERLAHHKPHATSWEAEINSPSGRHNAELFSAWLTATGMKFW